MGSLIILTISLLHLLPLFNSIIIKPWVVRILTVHHALQKILHIFRTSNECIVIHIWNISLPLLGGAALDLNSVEPKPRRWILDITWLNLVQLSSVHPFTQLLTQVTHNDRSWSAWFDEPAPEEAPVPDGYDSMLDTFRKLLLIRSWCPDRTIAQVGVPICCYLGLTYELGQCLLNQHFLCYRQQYIFVSTEEMHIRVFSRY